MEAVAHQLKNGPAALFKACWMPKTDDEPAERWSLSTTGDWASALCSPENNPHGSLLDIASCYLPSKSRRARHPLT